MPLGLPLTEQVAAVAVACLLVAPVLTLLHELGHAAVALLVSGGRIHVLVGRPPGVVRCRVGRVALTAGPLVPRGVALHGLCVRERTSTSPRDELAVSLAGPAATLAATSALAAGSIGASQSAPWVALVLLYGAVTGLASFLYNADPRSAGPADGAAHLRDGPRALLCYRLWRAGKSMPGARAAAPASGAEHGDDHQGDGEGAGEGRGDAGHHVEGAAVAMAPHQLPVARQAPDEEEVDR